MDIDNDLGERLRQRAVAKGISFKEALNRALAAGLDVWEEPTHSFRVKAKECGFRNGLDLNHLNRLADDLEDEDRKTGLYLT